MPAVKPRYHSVGVSPVGVSAPAVVFAPVVLLFGSRELLSVPDAAGAVFVAGAEPLDAGGFGGSHPVTQVINAIAAKPQAIR